MRISMMSGMLVRILLLTVLASSLYSLDLKNATIVAGPQDRKAAQMLTEAIEKRTRIRLAVAERAPASGATIVLGGRPTIPAVAGADGYRVEVANGSVILAGNDRRGTLFAAGALLRNLRMDRDSVEIADGW